MAERTGYAVYDALILASALEADCDTIWFEDMQDGQAIDRRLTIRNPFRPGWQSRQTRYPSSLPGTLDPRDPDGTLTLHPDLLGDVQVSYGASRAVGLDAWLGEARACGIGAVETVAAGFGGGWACGTHPLDRDLEQRSGRRTG